MTTKESADMVTPRQNRDTDAPQDGSGGPVPGTDVRDYLKQAADLSAAAVADLLSADQWQRWRRGEHIPAEAYLHLHRALTADHREALDLIFGEVLLREEDGERPSLTEYLWRFPGLAEGLKRQFEVHQGVQAGDPAETPRDVPAPNSGSSDGPTALGHYQILGELGHGGMGVVYKARQAGLDRQVALKVLRDGPFADGDQLARFRREAAAVAGLRHPHIVQVYEFGEEAGRPFFSMEYVEGGSLDKQLAGTPRPPRVAAELVQTLARAIHAAHQCGIIHRDLKPANVLLTPDGTPKIGDFGLAKVLAPSTESGAEAAGQALAASGSSARAIIGTPSYMAPEQAGGQGKVVGPAADVYALGAILYELLTGRPPFKAATPLETVDQVLHLDPVSPRSLQPGVPRDLQTICLKCLHKEPGQRYARAEELAEDLGRFLSGTPVKARPTPWCERGMKWARRKPGWAAAAGLTLATVVVLAVGSVYLSEAKHFAERQQELAVRRFEEAEAAHRQYADLIDELVSKDPRNLNLILQILQRMTALGIYQEQLDLEDKFINRLQTMLTEEPQPERRRQLTNALRSMHVIRAHAHCKVGHVDKAAADIEVAAADSQASPLLIYDCATVLSQASATNLPGTNGPDKEAAERYTARAVELLRKAATGGLFKDQATIEQMKKDADLEPLRGRADYQQFLDSLTVSNPDHNKSKDRRHDNPKNATSELPSPDAKAGRSRTDPLAGGSKPSVSDGK